MKLLLIYTVTTLLVFSVAGGYWVYSNYQSHQVFFQQRIEKQAEMVASNIGAAVMFEDSRAIQDVLSALRMDDAILSARVLNREGNQIGRVELHPRDASDGSLILWFLGEQHQGTVVVAIEEAGQYLGRVEVDFDRCEIHDAVRAAAWVALISTLLAIALGTLLASRLQNRVTGPIRQLSQMAREVTQTSNYSLRSAVNSKDEVGELSQDFDSMLELIEHREKRLEAMVEERTAELINKNDALASQIAESRRLSEELKHQASHDTLTGLANRRVLNQALAAVNKDSRNHDKQHTLCILDLDQFKTVNDTCGHMAGDELLCQVAQVIRNNVREDDLVVRLGGDEFALLLYHCNREEAVHLTEAIRKAIEDIHFPWEGNTFRISASIGAMASSMVEVDTNEALQQVDSACFAAKEAGRNRVHIIAPQDRDCLDRQGEMQWLHRLHQAMEFNRFVIYAQPIFPLNKGDCTEYVEILLRLRDTDGTLVPPGAFLPAAERFGLSVKLDQWLILHLLDNMPRYRQAFGDKRSYWVNLSGSSISDEKFLEFLETTVRNSDLPPGMLNFEITETSVIRNLSVARDTIMRLRGLGCQFSLDDFGSGMSSYGYLKNLPVDTIKIDGMFIRDMLEDKVDMVFVRSIIDIASAMGIKVIAEYVENPDILSKVIELGIAYAQGYALGMPEELLSEELRQAI
jgi:diguanylate cyclase (GGDEF)-like protein